MRIGLLLTIVLVVGFRGSSAQSQSFQTSDPTAHAPSTLAPTPSVAVPLEVKQSGDAFATRSATSSYFCWTASLQSSILVAARCALFARYPTAQANRGVPSNVLSKVLSNFFMSVFSICGVVIVSVMVGQATADMTPSSQNRRSSTRPPQRGVPVDRHAGISSFTFTLRVLLRRSLASILVV
jgi:hypothetical protein